MYINLRFSSIYCEDGRTTYLYFNTQYDAQILYLQKQFNKKRRLYYCALNIVKCMECDYRLILLHIMIQRVATLYRTLLHTFTPSLVVAW
jgi:hypothetical protein